MDGLVLMGPFLYLFLIPAITMRTFSEERRTGTIELLLTRGLSDWTIVWAKFLAAWTLVCFSLIPTVVCYLSVVTLGDPVGNIDSGSVAGSYIGLLFLGAVFAAVGIFVSSMTDSQITAFVFSVLLCFLLWLAFDFIYSFHIFGNFGYVIKNLGISHHYASISRGVVDSRDILYFLSVIVLFLYMARLRLQSRNW